MNTGLAVFIVKAKIVLVRNIARDAADTGRRAFNDTLRVVEIEAVEQRLAGFEAHQIAVVRRGLPGTYRRAHVVKRLADRHKGIFRLAHLGHGEVYRFIRRLCNLIIPGVHKHQYVRADPAHQEEQK